MARLPLRQGREEKGGPGSAPSWTARKKKERESESAPAEGERKEGTEAFLICRSRPRSSKKQSGKRKDGGAFFSSRKEGKGRGLAPAPVEGSVPKQGRREDV